MRKRFIRAIAIAVMVMAAGDASAISILVGGGVGDWGITDQTNGFATTDAVNAPVSGYNNGVWYVEEKGAKDPWGYVGPGYGGYPFDIQGLYFTYDESFMYVASILGTPPEGSRGVWNGTTWGGTEYLGDIALSFDGSTSKYEYGLETRGTDRGKFKQVDTWTAAAYFPQSSPSDIKTGSNTGLGSGFVYEKLPGMSSLYYIESRIALPSFFNPASLDSINVHLTQTCGNDAADLRLTMLPAPVPEPATALLWALGIFALFASGLRMNRLQ
ncbi:MAG: hypothetical protein HZA20_04050 [Nitrospirae bacterium]|nr:hypothetical protein [Nitrospirota bacterium]